MRKLFLSIVLLFLTTLCFSQINVGTNFNITGQLPIDVRYVKADTVARNAISSTFRYEGLNVYVISEGVTYILKGGITNSNWKEIGGYSPWDTTSTSIIQKDVNKYVNISKLDVLAGEADSAMRPDWNNGGRLSMQAVSTCPVSDSSKWNVTGNNIYNKNTGNVGIGTNTPDSLFTVDGGINIANDAMINGITIGHGGGDRSTNTALGTSVLATTTTGSANTGVGYISLYSNTTGYSNTAVGVSSLYSNTTASNLVAVGDSALYSNTIGVGNTAVGSKALKANTGSYNTAVGYQAIKDNTSTSRNTAVGYLAGTNFASNDNTAVGNEALRYSTNGGYNTAVGSASLGQLGNSNYSYNVGLGYLAGYWTKGMSYNAAFNNCTYVGADTRASASGNTNETAIGYLAIGRGSNTTRLGNTSVTDTYIGGTLRVDSIPNDVAADSLVTVKDGRLYRTLRTSIDTTSLSNRINTKQNISDTNSVDATRYWVRQQGYELQSNKQNSTSTSTVKYPTWYAAKNYVDSTVSTISGMDTTSLSNRIDKKQFYADTNTYDATRHWVVAQSYELQSNKSNTTSTSTIKYPTWNGAKNYADSIKSTIVSSQWTTASPGITYADTAAPSALMTPSIVGGIAVGSKVTYVSTTANGTASSIGHEFKVGNNGGTTTMTMLNDGKINMGSDTAFEKLTVEGNIRLSSNTIQPSVMSSDHTSSGDCIMLIAGATNAIGDVVYIASTGKTAICKADAIANCPYALAVCVTVSVTANNYATYMTKGVLRDDSWAWTTGSLLYIKNDAATGACLSHTPPSSTNNVIMPVAIALSATSIYFFGNINSVEKN